MQDIKFDYCEKGKLIEGKALLLTTSDIQKFDHFSFRREAHEVLAKVIDARILGYRAVILITSLPKEAIPVRIRVLLTETKNCWMCYL